MIIIAQEIRRKIMIEIDGKKYLTKEEAQKLHDGFIYLLNFKESMIECYKGQIRVLEELLDKLLLELKEKNNGLL